MKTRLQLESNYSRNNAITCEKEGVQASLEERLTRDEIIEQTTDVSRMKKHKETMTRPVDIASTSLTVSPAKCNRYKTGLFNHLRASKRDDKHKR